MGLMLSRLEMIVYSKKQIPVLMTGFNFAGKSAIVHQLKHGQVLPIDTIITVGYKLETLDYKDLSFLIWEIGGQTRMVDIKMYWKHCLCSTQSIILVVERTDRDRIIELRDHLHLFMKEFEDKQKKATLLVYANKQDLPDVMSVTEITDKLDLRSLVQHRWHVQAASAVTGEGLHKGLDWMYRNAFNKPSYDEMMRS